MEPVLAITTPVTEVHVYNDVRYLIVAGFTAFLYDIILTMPDEIQVVWKSPWFKFPKIAYLLNRYGMIAYASFYMIASFPSWRLSSVFCGNFTTATISLDVFTATMGNAVVLYELIILWDAKGNLALLMASGFIGMHSVTVVFAGFAAVQLRWGAMALNLSSYSTCTIQHTPEVFLGIYIPAALLDVYAFTLLLFNAFSRPRTSSQRLLDLLYRDGLIFFLTTFCMRLICILFLKLSPTSFGIPALGFPGTIVSAAVSRLYLRLHSTRFLEINGESSPVSYDSFTEETELRAWGQHQVTE